jgi:hypothetical protein
VASELTEPATSAMHVDSDTDDEDGDDEISDNNGVSGDETENTSLPATTKPLRVRSSSESSSDLSDGDNEEEEESEKIVVIKTKNEVLIEVWGIMSGN